MSDDATELRQLFLVETDEQLGMLEQALMALEAPAADGSALSAAFRAIHTVKGSAALLGFDDISRLAHEVEDVLELMRAGKLPWDRDLVTVLLQSVDAVRSMTLEIRVRGGADMDRFEHLRSELTRFRESGADGAKESDAARHCPSPVPGPVNAPSKRGPQAVHVDLGKLERLLESVSEIATARRTFGRQLTRVLGTEGHDLLAHFADSQKLFDEVRNAVMDMRLVAVAPRFRRFERAVRDAAHTTGKQARLVVEDGSVELDVAVVERLVEPLTHLVRNAVDHGIESADERVRCGKSPVGTVTLRAQRDGSTVTVDVVDDGAGISRNALEKRAKSWGIEDPARLSDTELHELLFLPGFSTAERVSELSGRGVGMDAVRTAVEAMRGSIEITSDAGAGSVVSIRVPLTLATIAALEVSVGDGTFLIPLDRVVEVTGAGAMQERDALSIGRWSDHVIPIAVLRRLLGSPGEAATDAKLVVVQHGRQTAALLVDSVRGELEAVMRPLGGYSGAVAWVGGTVVLEDGDIGLVLDIPALVRELERPTTLVGRACLGADEHPQFQGAS